MELLKMAIDSLNRCVDRHFLLLTPFDFCYFLIGSLILGWLVYALLKYTLLPWMIQKAVKDLPLDKDLKFNCVSMDTFTDNGYMGKVDFEIMNSLVLIPGFHLKVLPMSTLKIADSITQQILVEISGLETVDVVAFSNVRITQKDLEISVPEIILVKDMMRRIFLGGEEELKQFSFLIEFNATFDFWNGFLQIERLPLQKIVFLSDLIQKERNTLKQQKMDGDMSVGLYSLLPHPTFTSLPAVPTLGSIVSGLRIDFTSPPTLEVSLPVIRCKVLLNGSSVAEGVIQGLVISKERSHVSLSVELIPLVVSKPIRGTLTTARGVLRGALTGALNGLLFGEWGAGSSVIGVTEIQIADKHGKRIRWIETLLEALEIEKDVEALKQVKNKAGDVAHSMKDGIMNITAGIVDVAISKGSKCSLM